MESILKGRWEYQEQASKGGSTQVGIWWQVQPPLIGQALLVPGIEGISSPIVTEAALPLVLSCALQIDNAKTVAAALDCEREYPLFRPSLAVVLRGVQAGQVWTRQRVTAMSLVTVVRESRPKTSP